MRYAIIADIHANIRALEAVLAGIEAIGVDRTLCLGDLVGYNPEPNECVDIIRGRGLSTCMGNHDSVASGLEEPLGYNPAARESVFWTRGVLTEVNKAFLLTLPFPHLVVDEILLVHGSVRERDEYIFGVRDAAPSLLEMEDKALPRVCFFGHTHRSVLYEWVGDKLRQLPPKEHTLNPEGRYLINPGSVGQPRDGDPRSAFLVLDTEAATVAFHRVGYDIDGCYRRILEVGLPRRLGERLYVGL